MKKLFFILLISVASVTVHAQMANTKWKVTLKLEQPMDAIFAFGKDTLVVTGVADGSVIETMTYSVKDNILTITKVSGQSECEDGSIGKYKLEKKGTSLLVTVVSDDCTDRGPVLDGTTWEKS
jgi:hypothetical protein